MNTVDIQPTQETFDNNVEDHIVTNLMDTGVYRHLRCSRPDSSMQHFEIVTTPGYLYYTGDMGAFVFTRVLDMFEFFRSPFGEINPMYWAEKCVAMDRTDGITAFSHEKFQQKVLFYMGDQDGELTEDIRQRLQEEVFIHDDSEECSMRSALDFEVDGRYPLQDFWEVDCRTYTYRFIWCLRAIVWTINKYDAKEFVAHPTGTVAHPTDIVTPRPPKVPRETGGEEEERWYVASTGNHQGLVVSMVDGRNVAVAYDKKDALLIAAAPALWEILASIMPLYDREDVADEWADEFDKAQDILASLIDPQDEDGSQTTQESL